MLPGHASQRSEALALNLECASGIYHLASLNFVFFNNRARNTTRAQYPTGNAVANYAGDTHLVPPPVVGDITPFCAHAAAFNSASLACTASSAAAHLPWSNSLKVFTPNELAVATTASRLSAARANTAFCRVG